MKDFESGPDVDIEDQIHNLVSRTSSRDDVVTLLKMSREAHLQEVFHNQYLGEYISGLRGYTNGVKGLCKNYGRDYPEQPSWRWIAWILDGAFEHT